MAMKVGGEVTINGKWNSIQKYLLDEKIAYHMVLLSDIVLVHPRNRGGLGIHAFNAHVNGGKIVHVGEDLDDLKKATVIEIAKDLDERQRQFDFNSV